ncbi:MAG: FG-GAP-like repeat-containing protein [Myxococcota bacterium]
METPTPDPDGTIQTVDTLGHAIDGALGWDAVEEERALGRIERNMFARAREPLKISRYLLLRPLGSGGTGVVYDGYDPELARRVAVKVLRSGSKDVDAVARARARFVREAQSIARLSHANVIGVYDVGTYSASELSGPLEPMAPPEDSDETGVFIVMELVEGSDLASWLGRGPRSWREVVEVFLEAGEGLDAAHRAGLIHRDFKPANVLLGDDGRVKVVDFGLALTYGGSITGSRTGEGTPMPVDEGSEPEPSVKSVALDKLTRTGVILGTPAYMAPEQHRGDPADQEADQFAFCASLYRALYGVHAFEGRSIETLFVSKTRGQIRTPPEKVRVPAWVHRVVLRGLEPDPRQRFANMAALLQALRADPVRRVKRWSSRAAVGLGVAAIAYAGYVGTRPGQVRVVASAQGQPVPGVQVEIDEQPLPGAQGEVAAGLHRVRVSAPDYDTAETVVDVRRGGMHEVAVELDHQQGTFELELEPSGGHVFIDGTDYGSRLRGLKIDTGPHELLLRHEGYVDQRLQWTATAGQTQRGFVALRKALSWSRPATGAFLGSWWLGDVNGDGLDDLLQRRFTVLTAYDPWSDEENWRIELGPSPYFRLCDLEGDGVPDVVTAKPREEVLEFRAFDSTTSSRRPKPRWTVDVPVDAEVERPFAFELACVDAEGGQDLVVGGLAPRQLARFDGQTGARHWSQVLPEDPVVLVVTSDPESSPAVAVVSVDHVTSFDTDDGSTRWTRPLAVAARTPDGGVDPEWIVQTQRNRDSRISRLAALELDDQPGQDLLLRTDGEGASLVALSGRSGEVQWQAKIGSDVALKRDRDLGDVDGDGTVDVLVSGLEGEPGLNLISGRSGKALWKEPARVGTHAQLLGSLARPAVAHRREETLMLLDAATGRESARVTLPSRVVSALEVTDWDGDARDDLMVGTEDGLVRVFDPSLKSMGTVPIGVPARSIEASRDANHDGFEDLLLRARGPAVMVGPKVRWERRPLDSIRATPLTGDFDEDGRLEVAVVGPLGDRTRIELLDARTGSVEAESLADDTPNVIRPPVMLSGSDGPQLYVVGRGLSRFHGRDASLTGEYRTTSAYASPTIADLDGDGHHEVIMVTWEDPGMVHVLDAESLELRWTHELGRFGSFGAAHVRDLDGDGANEIVVALLDGHVVALTHDGVRRWETQTGGRLNFEPTSADLDGDGHLEILVSPHQDDHPLVVLSGVDGHEVARWPGMASRRARPLAADVDGDGVPEVFASTGHNGLVGLSGDGRLRWQYRFADGDGLQPGASGSPVLADLEGDGGLEFLAGFDDGSVHVVDARTGALVWRFSTGREEVEASPAVADVDGDGQLEVFVAGHDRSLLCLDHRPGPG